MELFTLINEATLINLSNFVGIIMDKVRGATGLSAVCDCGIS